MTIVDEALSNTLCSLGYCYLCGEQGGLEEHHIVPQCYGGVDSPLVTLCGVCHTNVHALSDAAVARSGTFNAQDVLAISTKWKPKEAFYFATVICRAKALVEGDPNKKIRFSTTFDGVTSMRLKELKGVLPDTRSQHDVIVYAINHLHKTLFRKR